MGASTRLSRRRTLVALQSSQQTTLVCWKDWMRSRSLSFNCLSTACASTSSRAAWSDLSTQRTTTQFPCGNFDTPSRRMNHLRVYLMKVAFFASFYTRKSWITRRTVTSTMFTNSFASVWCFAEENLLWRPACSTMCFKTTCRRKSPPAIKIFTLFSKTWSSWRAIWCCGYTEKIPINLSSRSTILSQAVITLMN